MLPKINLEGLEACVVTTEIKHCDLESRIEIELYISEGITRVFCTKCGVVFLLLDTNKIMEDKGLVGVENNE